MIAPMARKKNSEKKPRDWYRKQSGVTQLAVEIPIPLNERLEAVAKKEQRLKRVIVERALEAYCRKAEESQEGS